MSRKSHVTFFWRGNSPRVLFAKEEDFLALGVLVGVWVVYALACKRESVCRIQFFGTSY